jgi:hypothetical protein
LRVSSEADVSGDALTDVIEEKISVADSDTMLSLTERHTLNETSPSLQTEYSGMASPVNVTLTNADILPLLEIMYSTQDYYSNRTDYMAGNAYSRAFWNRIGGEPVKMSLQDEPSLARVLSSQSNGIPEVDYGEAEMLYTARFVAALPELVNAEQIKNYINYSGKLYDYGTDTITTPGDAYFEVERAAGYLALAALKQPVLLEIQSQIALIENASDQESFFDTYEGRLRVMLYAAALCAIGDDAKAAYLIEKYCAVPIEGLDETKTEMLAALGLFCQTVLDAPAAMQKLAENKEPNKFVSDVLERIFFLKTAVPVSGVVSEVSYTLDGATETVVLNNFECVHLVVTAEQYDALNVTRVSGNTNVNVAFAGSPANLPDSLNAIKITKAVEPYEGYDGMYKVTITLHEDPGHKLDDGKYYYYTIYDRVPSNMRFTEPGLADGDRSWATAEGQHVNIWAYTRGNQTSYSFYYYTMLISDAEAVIPEAYISRNFNLANAWGSAK